MDKKQQTYLGTRFHALPPELRAYIFSFLLVRPVKWDVRHLESCTWSSTKTRSIYTRPSHHLLEDSGSTYTCAECGPGEHRRHWRLAMNRGLEVYVSPLRSKWAPEQTNPYLCTNCYDDRLRPRPFPQTTNLGCLCARRNNLETRLVCRQWNKEASTVFFSDNIFAFDDCTSMGDFFAAIPRRWKTLIKKVSLLLPFWEDSIDPAILLDEAKQTDVALLAKSLSVLDELPWLQCLELDAKLLNYQLTASALLNCRITDLQRVSFVLRCPYRGLLYRKMELPNFVWRELRGRHLLKGGFSEYVARAMKSQGINTLKNHKMTLADVAQQRQLCESLQNDSEFWEIKHQQCDADR